MLSAVRTAVLKHLRLPAPSAIQQQVVVPSISAVVIRGFAGGFLDKDKVTERVMYVAKHFEKVDPAKASLYNSITSLASADLWVDWASWNSLRPCGTPSYFVFTKTQVAPGAHFEKDLGLDSLDVVELVMALEEEFGVEIPDAEADKIASVTDAVNYMMSNPLAK